MREVVAVGKRVSLRPVREEEVAATQAWYEEAAKTAYETRPLRELWSRSRGPGSGLFAIAESDGDQPVGLLEYEVRDGWLAVPFIALAQVHRGWGYGSEAVRLLEEWAVRARSAKRFRADVPVGNGLALYFWLRLGYRPAGRNEFGWRGEDEGDRMAMVRVG